VYVEWTYSLGFLCIIIYFSGFAHGCSTVMSALS
jgi:hypothetical protein